MTDKEKIHQILSSLWKSGDNSVGKTYYNQALQDVQTAIDLQEEPISEELEKKNKIEILANIIFNAAKHGYMPYDTQDEYCAMEIARKNIDKFIAPKKQEKPVSEGRDIFDNCLKGEEKFILPQKISGNINCENCLYSSACALGDIKACIIDKPVSEELEEAIEDTMPDCNWRIDDVGDEVYEDAYNSIQMANMFKAGAKWQKAKDESTTEDLGEYINELSKQFPEVSFAKLSRIAVRVAKWQKEQIMKGAIDARCFGFQGAALFSFRLPADNYLVGSEVKVIVVNYE